MLLESSIYNNNKGEMSTSWFKVFPGFRWVGHSLVLPRV